MYCIIINIRYYLWFDLTLKSLKKLILFQKRLGKLPSLAPYMLFHSKFIGTLMKFLYIFMVFSIFLAPTLDAGKWNKPLYLNNGHMASNIESIVFDSLYNMWVGTNACLWKVNKDADSVSFIPYLTRGDDTVTYSNFPASYKADASIFFHGQTAVASCADTLLYLTQESIIKFDESYPLFKEIEFENPRLDKIVYYDSSFYMILRNSDFIFPGIFKLSERDSTLTRVFRFDSEKYLPELMGSARYLTTLNNQLIYPSELYGATTYNSQTAERKYVDFREKVKDTNMFVKSSFLYDGIMYFTTGQFQFYKLNMTSFDFTVEDLTTSPLYLNNIEEKSNMVINIKEVNEDYMLFLGIDVHRDSSLYIRYNNTNKWELINLSPDEECDLVSRLNIHLTPDKTRLWFYFRWWTPVEGDDGKKYSHFLRSYDIYASPDNVEETEALPTLYPTKVYPNPAKRSINVDFFIHPDFSQKVKFQIYNYMGIIIKDLDGSYTYNAQTAFGKKQIDIENLHHGIYYFVIDNGSEKRSIGFAVE